MIGFELNPVGTRARVIALAAPDDHRAPAVLDLCEAAALLGVGRTTAYKLVREKKWPTPVLRLGRLIKIPTEPLLDLLRGTPPGGTTVASAIPAVDRETVVRSG